MIKFDHLKAIDLPRFLEQHYGIRVNGNGAARCPFHDHDDKPSLSVQMRNGVGVFKCHACGAAGSILDFVAKREELSLQDAARRIAELEGITEEAEPAGKPKVVATYSYTDEDGAELYKILRYEPKDFKADRKLGNTRRVLYHLPQLLVGDPVWLVEGEKDVLNAEKIGLVATTAPFGVTHWRSEFNEPLKNKAVRVCLDAGYRQESEKKAQEIAKVAREVKVVELPDLVKNEDITDWIERHDAQSAEDLKVQLEKIADEMPVFGAGTAGEKFDLVELTDVEMEPIEYVWYPVAAYGMVGTVLGPPGVGKTYMLADISARISRGDALPVYRTPTEKVAGGWVVYITSEGSPSQILKPRLYAAKAEMSNITLIKGRVSKKGDFTLLDIRFHLDELAKLMQADGRKCVLVIIDPLASFVSGNANLNDMTQTRQALDVVARFAETAGVAVLVAIHPNKNETQQLQNRAAGSVQMSAAVKFAWAVVDPKDDDPPNLRYFAPYKIATAPCNRKETLPFYLDDASFEHNGRHFEMAKLRWSLKTVSCDVERIMSPRAAEGVNMSAKARALIREQLQEGPKPGRDMLRAGEEIGVSPATMYKAKAQLNVDDSPDDWQGPRMWIPPAEWPDKN